MSRDLMGELKKKGEGEGDVEEKKSEEKDDEKFEETEVCEYSRQIAN